MSERTLRELRLEVRTIDSQLVTLLARRFRLARKIGEQKRRLKKPIIDPTVERSVVENFTNSATEAGIDLDFARRLVNVIIEGSVEVQASMQPIFEELPGVRVAVIGAGGMGSWFARFFKSRGALVTISDRSRRRARVLASKIRARCARSNVEAVRGSDVVILATPTNAVSQVIAEILPALGRNTILVDIAAVKSPIMPALGLVEKRGIRVLSIHPMFGPLASSLREKSIVVVRTPKHEQDPHRVKDMLGSARIISVDPKVHDKQTAYTLALPHFLNMAFAMTMPKRSDTEIREFAGRTFNLQMLLAETVANEPETTADIQIMNTQFLSVLCDLERNVKWLADTVKRGNRAELITRFQRIRKRLSSDPEFAIAGQALEKAYNVISIESRRQKRSPISRGLLLWSGQ
jgi:prephenate dehydrogenase/chorismate mutase